jgi:hypothetical protein
VSMGTVLIPLHISLAVLFLFTLDPFRDCYYDCFETKDNVLFNAAATGLNCYGFAAF